MCLQKNRAQVALAVLHVFSSLFSNGGALKSTVGRDFVFGFIWNGASHLQQAMVSNANDQPTIVNVTSIHPAFQTINVTIQPNSVKQIDFVSWDTMQLRDSHCNASVSLVVENKGIRIQSTLDVAVYAHSESRNADSADSFTILPTDHLGIEYVEVGARDVCFFPNVLMAIAYQDNTTIIIRNQTVTINALQVVSLEVCGIASGITVSGSKPFAAYSGNKFPFDESTQEADLEMTTLIPTTLWGTQFPLVPFAYVTNQSYQIVANTNGTIVNVSITEQSYRLDAGQYLEITVDDSAMLTSNFPIQLVQLGQRADFDDGVDYYGDLFFMQLPSVDNWSNISVPFQPLGVYTSDDEHGFMHFIRIYTTQSGVGLIAIDNVNINSSDYHCIAQSNFYYYETQSTNDTHRISTCHPNVIYLALSYTYGYYVGSGFPIAYSLEEMKNSAESTTDTKSSSTSVSDATTIAASTSSPTKVVTTIVTSTSSPTKVVTTIATSVSGLTEVATTIAASTSSPTEVITMTSTASTDVINQLSRTLCFSLIVTILLQMADCAIALSFH